MDALWFLERRTSYIRWYHSTACRPFVIIKSQIEEALPPFDNAPCDESGEPAFLEEWEDADEALNIVGSQCISMLSGTLKAYFKTLENRVIGFSLGSDGKKMARAEGFVPAYISALSEIFNTDWSSLQNEIALIEQIVLARNNIQHSGDIRSLSVDHDARTIRKFPRLFFSSKEDLSLVGNEGYQESTIYQPTVVVSEENLLAALLAVDKLARWINANLDKVGEWRAGKRSPAADPVK